MWKRQLILSVLWLAIAAWYWRTYVPLLPTRSAELTDESSWVGWTPEGHLVVSRVVFDVNRDFVEHYGGPISIWRIPELEKISERFEPADEIETRHMFASSGLVVLGSDTSRRIVDVRTGETLEDIPPDVREVTFGDGPYRGALYRRDDSVTLRDVRSSKDVWTATGIQARHVWMQGEFVQAFLQTQSGTGSGGQPMMTAAGLLLLKAATGEIDTRFDAVGPLHSLLMSDDGRWALVQKTSGSTQMCDARTGRSLWTLDLTLHHWPRFDTKRDELYLDWAAPGSDELQESRWRCSDGAELSPPPPQTYFHWAYRTTDVAGRLAIDGASPQGYFEQFCGMFLNPALKTLGSERRLPTERSVRVLRDLTTGRIIGPMPTDRFVQFIPGGSAAIAVGGRRIDVYEFPARRDWNWLAWTALGPIVAAAMTGGLWSAGRRLRRVRRSRPEINAAQAAGLNPAAQ